MFAKLIKISASTLLTVGLLSGAAFAQGGAYQWHQNVPSSASPAAQGAVSAIAAVSTNALYTLQAGETDPSAAPRYNSGAIIAAHPNWVYRIQNGTL